MKIVLASLVVLYMLWLAVGMIRGKIKVNNCVVPEPGIDSQQELPQQ